MMITNYEIKLITRLASLHLSDFELPVLRADLRLVLKQALRLRDNPPSYTAVPTALSQARDQHRQDKISSSLSQVKAKKNAPQIHEDMLALPRMIL